MQHLVNEGVGASQMAPSRGQIPDMVLFVCHSWIFLQMTSELEKLVCVIIRLRRY